MCGSCLLPNQRSNHVLALCQGYQIRGGVDGHARHGAETLNASLGSFQVPHCEGADRKMELALGTPIQSATAASGLSNWNQAQSPVLIVIDCLPAKSGVIPSNYVPT